MKKLTPIILLIVFFINISACSLLCHSGWKESSSIEKIFVSANEFEETSNNDNSDIQPVNFLYESGTLQQQNSLVKNIIHLASLRDVAPVLPSQFVTPNTLPPKSNLFS